VAVADAVLNSGCFCNRWGRSGKPEGSSGGSGRVSRKGRRRSTESGISDTWSSTGRGRAEKVTEFEVITSANVIG
jgi:hypothetical protein